MERLKDGDAVRVYEEGGGSMLPDGVLDGDTGTVLSIDDDGMVYLELPSSPYGYAEVAPEQLKLAR